MGLTAYHGCTLLVVTFLTGSTSAQKPYVKNQPRDATVVIGQDVELDCVLANLLPGSLVMWTKGGFALGIDRQLSGFPRYYITGDENIGEYNLQIKNITLEDEDEYECQVTSHRIRTRAAMVTVQVLPKGPFVNDITNGVMDVRANVENLITCRSTNGKPAADLKWYRGGNLLKQNVTYAVTDESHKLHNGSATLRLWPGDKDDGVEFSCVMSTDVAPNNDKLISLTLNVQKPPIAKLVFEPSLDIIEGSTLAIVCDSSLSKPSATSYDWFVDGEKIIDKSDNKFTFENVEKSMNGNDIACQAVNSIGSSAKTSAKLNIMYPPILKFAPEKLIINSSDVAFFECEWDSNPPAEITWYRGDVLLGRGNTLTIDPVRQEDAGAITCAAKAGEIGSDEVLTKLVVLGPPVIEIEDQFATIGEEKGTIECNVSSAPGIQQVTWRWMHNNKEYILSDDETLALDSSPRDKHMKKIKFQSRFRPSSNVAELIIFNVNKEDLTSYNCSVMNLYGTGFGIIQLNESISSVPLDTIGYILGSIFGIIFIILIFMCAWIKWRRSYPRKSATITKYSQDDVELSQENGINASSHSFSSKQRIHNDPDSDNISTSSSATTPVGNEEVFIAAASNTHLTQNDDGYHTEEVSSWNNTDKSPGRNIYNTVEQGAPLLPTVASSPVSPSLLSKNSANTYHDSVFMQPKSIKDYNMSSKNELGVYPPHIPSNKSLMANPYSSLGRKGTSIQGYPYSQHSATPSVISSHRSINASPYVTRQYSVESHPTNSNYYSTSPVARKEPPYVANETFAENSSQLSHPSTRLSQSSRSSEMFQRPMTARMATHV